MHTPTNTHTHTPAPGHTLCLCCVIMIIIINYAMHYPPFELVQLFTLFISRLLCFSQFSCLLSIVFNAFGFSYLYSISVSYIQCAWCIRRVELTWYWLCTSRSCKCCGVLGFFYKLFTFYHGILKEKDVINLEIFK